MKVRVAGAQLEVSSDIRRNVSGILQAIGDASASGAQILLTPEGSLSGYTHSFDARAAASGLEEVTRAAREAKLGLALGTCFVEPDGMCYDELRFYGDDGAYHGFHSKILLCGTLTEPSVGEINHYASTELRTFALGGITVGGLICNDLWGNPTCTPMADPHLTQRLSDMGARIVFHSVNGGRDVSEWTRLAWTYHETNLRMRARAGRLWIVTVDSANPPTLPCSTPGGVIDPSGNWVCRAEPQGRQLFVHTIEIGGA